MSWVKAPPVVLLQTSFALGLDSRFAGGPGAAVWAAICLLEELEQAVALVPAVGSISTVHESETLVQKKAPHSRRT